MLDPCLGWRIAPAVCRFGAYELEMRNGELRKHGVRIKLQEQPRQILMLLLERPGEIVTRDEIQKRLWPRTGLSSISTMPSIAQSESCAMLSTTPPRIPGSARDRGTPGVPFAAPISLAPKEGSDPEPAPAVLPSVPGSMAPRHKWEWAAAVRLVVIAAILILMQRHTTSAIGVLNIKVQPLTSNLGLELQPSLSPDGTRVAYSWNGTNGGNFAIYTADWCGRSCAHDQGRGARLQPGLVSRRFPRGGTSRSGHGKRNNPDALFGRAASGVGTGEKGSSGGGSLCSDGRSAYVRSYLLGIRAVVVTRWKIPVHLGLCRTGFSSRNPSGFRGYRRAVRDHFAATRNRGRRWWRTIPRRPAIWRLFESSARRPATSMSLPLQEGNRTTVIRERSPPIVRM